MNLDSLISPDAVLCNVNARSKKHTLEILSELLTRSHRDIASEEIFEKLNERERLGCTSLQKGVAFPRCRLDTVRKSGAALLKLLDPVEFDAPDDEPVDLVFGLLVPAELDDSHYAEIEQLTELLSSDSLRARLRSATSSSELYDALLAAQHDPLPKLQHVRSRASRS